jgi:hypothetical protein
MTKRRAKSKKFTSSGITFLTMLSLLACFGAQTPCTKALIQVYSKLGGTFLGSIQRPCEKHEDAYSVLRKLQDQVATWLFHPKMPPRYLVLFVGTSRLTSPDFPFVDQVDTKSSQQVIDLLGKALRIEATWDEDPTRAKDRLASKGLGVSVSGHKLSLFREEDIDLKELLPMEVEAFTFGDTIHDVYVYSGAATLGCIHSFPHLERLSAGRLNEVDFKRLAQVKTLTNLDICTTCLTDDVGLMTNLKALSCVTSELGCIPTTIGLLTRLTSLLLQGSFTRTIPSEVGNLVELSTLTINGTNVSGSIPSEVCQLTKLTKLDLAWNPRLEGSLPDEFRNLKLLTILNLQKTPVKTNGALHGWRHHQEYESYWTRQV